MNRSAYVPGAAGPLLTGQVPQAPALAWWSTPHSADELREAGCRRWSGPPEREDWPGEHRLWLFPTEWAPAIPIGVQLVTISGRPRTWDGVVHYEDRLYRLLPCGVLASEGTDA